MLDPNKKKKKTPHIQGQRRSPNKMVGVAILHLELNTTPARNAWRARQHPVPTRTQEEESVTPQETGPDLPVRVQESPVEAWINSGCHGVRGTEYTVLA